MLAALMPPSRPARQSRRRGLRGLTLLELVIALAVLAVLGTLAAPSFSARLERQRLGAAAEALAADVQEARFEAARQGRPLHLAVRGGSPWCWAVATEPGCACGQPSSCTLRTAGRPQHPGVHSLSGAPLTLQPDGTTQAGTLVLASDGGLRLRLDIATLGRVRICSERGEVLRYPAC